MADLLRFVVALAAQDDLRDRFRHDPRAVLVGEVDDAAELTGEDVDAAAAWVRARLREAGDPRAESLRATGAVRPLGTETPGDAAVRILEELCTTLDDPERGAAPRQALVAVDEVPSPTSHPVAAGGGAPVPDAPPALRGRRLWAVGGEGSPMDPEHPVHGRPALHAVPEPADGPRYAALDLVRLPRGLPAAGIEPGAVGTVVAVDARGVEIEVADDDGARRFLGVVAPDDIVPLQG